MTTLKTHHGSCHCGHVQFEVTLDAAKAAMCNCSSCLKFGARGVSGKPEILRVLSDETTHVSYGAAWAKRYFCPTCFVYCYSRGDIPEVGGPFASINLNTLDDIDPNEAELTHWDGRHDDWRAGARATPWPVFRDGEPRERFRPVAAK